MATIAERLKELRQMKGLEQAELAKVAKVSRTAMGKYESGDVVPKATTLIEISQAYSVSMDWLCGLTDHSEINSPKTLYDFICLLPGLLKVGDGEIFDEQPNEFNRFTDITHLTFTTPTINTALIDAYKIIKLYNDGIIDNEVFELWKEKSQKKYSNIIIDDISNSTDITDNSTADMNNLTDSIEQPTDDLDPNSLPF